MTDIMANFNPPRISIIIRALNEAKFLPECLSMISSQKYEGDVEIVLVDSGSTDATLIIAENYSAKVVHIRKEEFTFGKSLNLGCEHSTGEILVLLSAHCIPTDDTWLNQLIKPIVEDISVYAYGRQIPRETVSKYSEGMVFKKYYPVQSAIPQVGYFCNNANSAISRHAWAEHKFDESLTGLEDMELAKRLVDADETVSYVAESVVEHIHEESWKRVKVRYEREAVALAQVDPNLTISSIYAIQIFTASIFLDWQSLKRKSFKTAIEIITYRFCQFYGAFIGSCANNARISKMKNEYFYPTTSATIIELGGKYENSRTSSNEGTQ